MSGTTKDCSTCDHAIVYPTTGCKLALLSRQCAWTQSFIYIPRKQEKKNGRRKK